MRFSILTCSYNNVEGVKATVEALRFAGTSGRSVVATLCRDKWKPGDGARSSAPARMPPRPGDPAVKPIEIEHIVIDGGSTDGTVEALRAEDGRLKLGDGGGYELKWISEPDRGLYDALNKGLWMATGDVIGILHTDDVWEPGVLHRVRDAFEGEDGRSSVASLRRDKSEMGDRGPNSQLPTPISRTEGVYGDLLYVDAEDVSKVRRVWRAGSYDKRKWWNGWMPPHPGLFVTRELAERVGDYRLDLGSAADYEWMLRAALVHGARLAYIGDLEGQKGSARDMFTFSPAGDGERENGNMHGLTPFVRMRVGGQSNVSTRARLRANRNDRRAWELNGLKPRPWTLWMKPIRKIPQWLRARSAGCPPAE